MKNQENQEKLIYGVNRGDVSIVDEIMSENFDVSSNNREALRAAKMKLFEAKSELVKAESIVGMLSIEYAANDSDLMDYENESLYKVVDRMADGNEEAKQILSEIIKKSPKNKEYVLDMDMFGISGDEIVAIYNFYERNLFYLFDVIDHESHEIISFLAEFNREGGSKNG